MKKMKRMIYLLLTIVVLVIGGIFFFLNRPNFGCSPRGMRLARIERSPNYRNGAFHNQEDTPLMASDRGRMSQLWHFLTDKQTPHLKPGKPLPAVRTDLKALPRDKNLLVWFGHSSYYMQIDGIRFLVDPVFYNASPVSFIMKPFKGTDIYKPSDIPDVDYLIITHDHWDHLDYQTVTRMRSRIGHVICPLGVGQDFEYWRYPVSHITEMDWGECAHLHGNTLLYCLPARHFSGRGLKSNQTLWASYMLQIGPKTLFLGGDGGYGKHFAVIGRQFPHIDLAILENGQYNEDWRYIHTMPNLMVREANDLHARRILSVHHGKFALSKHAWDEPLRNIQTMRKAGLDVLSPQIGEVVPL